MKKALPWLVLAETILEVIYFIFSYISNTVTSSFLPESDVHYVTPETVFRSMIIVIMVLISLALVIFQVKYFKIISELVSVYRVIVYFTIIGLWLFMDEFWIVCKGIYFIIFLSLAIITIVNYFIIKELNEIKKKGKRRNKSF